MASFPQRLGLALILLAATLAAYVYFGGNHLSDLLAVYLAGQQFEAGLLDQVYFTGNTVFDLSVPQSWPALAAQQDVGNVPLYPYIYPPLWAYVMGKITVIAAPQTVFLIAMWLFPLLLGLSAALCFRILRPDFSLLTWTLLGLGIAATTPVLHVALFQGQPQILVSFLIVLAIERRVSNAPYQAGLALALAASIKLYPALFVLIWIARKDWPPLRAFVVFGAALGMTSIAVAGWPMHQIFLSQISIISKSLLLTHVSFNFDTVLGQLLLADSFVPAASGVRDVYSAAKPLWLSLFTSGILILGLIWFWRQAKSCTETQLYLNLWPALMIFVSLFSPLTWVYHYLSVIFFLPILLDRPAGKNQKTITVFLIFLLNMLLLKVLARLDIETLIVPIIGTVVFSAFLVLFLRPLINRSALRASPQL